jgi:hypothetical protein
VAAPSSSSSGIHAVVSIVRALFLVATAGGGIGTWRPLVATVALIPQLPCWGVDAASRSPWCFAR